MPDPKDGPWQKPLDSATNQTFQDTMSTRQSSPAIPTVYARVLLFSNQALVDAKMYALRAQGDCTTKNNAAFQAEVAWVEFEKLTDEEWMVFVKNAKADKEAATKKYKDALAALHSKAPEDQQKYTYFYFIRSSCLLWIIINASTNWQISWHPFSRA
jgi:hypothetical protein